MTTTMKRKQLKPKPKSKHAPQHLRAVTSEIDALGKQRTEIEHAIATLRARLADAKNLGDAEKLLGEIKTAEERLQWVTARTAKLEAAKAEAAQRDAAVVVGERLRTAVEYAKKSRAVADEVNSLAKALGDALSTLVKQRAEVASLRDGAANLIAQHSCEFTEALFHEAGGGADLVALEAVKRAIDSYIEHTQSGCGWIGTLNHAKALQRERANQKGK